MRVDAIITDEHLSDEDVLKRMAKRGDTRATTFLERKHQRQVSAADRWNKREEQIECRTDEPAGFEHA